MILYLSLYSIAISIVISIYNWRINRNALYLSGIFVLFSTYLLTYYFCTESEDPIWIAIFYSNFTPFWYLLGPFLYFYVRNTISDNSHFRKGDYLHFLPFLIHLINMAPYLISPFSYKMEVAKLIIADFNNVRLIGGGFLYPTAIATASRPVLILLYCIASSILLYRYKAVTLLIKQNRIVLIWIIILIVTIFIVVISYFLVTLMLFDSHVSKLSVQSRPAHLLSGIAFFLLPTCLFLFFPQILYGMPIAGISKSKKTSKKNTSNDTEDPLTETANLITDYIINEKAYLNPDFEIINIVIALNIPRHHIVYCFSEILNIKFTSYRSKLRIEHAKTLLKAGSAETLSIDGIGAQSGFSSRSGFYATFKAETGMTPSQYLESL